MKILLLLTLFIGAMFTIEPIVGAMFTTDDTRNFCTDPYEDEEVSPEQDCEDVPWSSGYTLCILEALASVNWAARMNSINSATCNAQSQCPIIPGESNEQCMARLSALGTTAADNLNAEIQAEFAKCCDDE